MHLAIIKVFYYQLMHKRIAFKGVLTFTLKQLQNVSVCSPSSGSVLYDLANLVVWLHMRPHHQINHTDIF